MMTPIPQMEGQVGVTILAACVWANPSRLRYKTAAGESNEWHLPMGAVIRVDLIEVAEVVVVRPSDLNHDPGLGAQLGGVRDLAGSRQRNRSKPG